MSTCQPSCGPLLRLCRRLAPALMALLGTPLLVGCGDALTRQADATEAPAPLVGIESAYAHAATRVLDAREPENHEDLHHVYRLSENILSGAEPHGEAGLARIASYGARTVISVDGKAPDAEAAARHGLRYVHIPIQYKGIRPDELLRLAKTFRELPAPFFIHCFHGVHRGPAAAAIGRLVLDGADREQALAEMRQYCGTSGKYEGLYRVIASVPMPTAAATRAFVYDFPAAHRFGGFRQAMVGVSRHYDHLESLVKRDWVVDPEHPDLNAVSEARMLAAALGDSLTCGDRLCTDSSDHDPEYDGWLSQSQDLALRLAEELGAVSRGEEGAGARARESFMAVQALCTTCHARHRNK